MGKFDFALPRPLKVELEIPGYDAKRAAERLHKQDAHERERFRRQNGLGKYAKAPVTPPAPPPTPADDVYELQASLRAAHKPALPDLAAALDLPTRADNKKRKARK